MYANSVWEMGAGGCRKYLNSNIPDNLIRVDRDSWYNYTVQIFRHSEGISGRVNTQHYKHSRDNKYSSYIGMVKKAHKKVLKQKHIYTSTGITMVQNDTAVLCSYNHQQI